MKKAEVRKRLAAYQRDGRLRLTEATMINNSQRATINQLVEDINQCIEWQERHPDRKITSAELASSHKLPEPHFFTQVFGSVPKFLEFFYD